MLKYQLPTGEVIELDLDDYLDIDKYTLEGKRVYQEILCNKNTNKLWESSDLAELEDSLKFFDLDTEIKSISEDEKEIDEMFKNSLGDLLE